jgi:hypothetical protein
MQTNAVAYPADVPRGPKEDREKLSVAETIVGWRGSLRGILSQLQAVAPTNTTVLLAGESGTGKEVIARAIHELSPRRGRNLVKVNCAAIPAGLLETEMFGHERGAFTGAINSRVGRFALADHGTLFLAGARVRGGRQHAHDAGGCPCVGSHQPRSAGNGSRPGISRGFVLSAQCISHRFAAAAGTKSGHPGIRAIFRARVRVIHGQNHRDHPRGNHENAGRTCVAREYPRIAKLC